MLIVPVMRPFIYLLFIIGIGVWISCKKNEEEYSPDVSNIEVHISIQRFDKDFFALQPDHLKEQLPQLNAKYPFFYKDFMENILGLDITNPKNERITLQKIRQFLIDYHPLYIQLMKEFTSLHSYRQGLERAFQYLKYYFPSYPLPRVVSFIGPMDALFFSSFGMTPDILADSLVGISLLLHQGNTLKDKNNTPLLTGLVENYILPRLNPQSIVCSVMKNIVEDMFPDNNSEKTLIEQMVERGKRYYLLHHFLPQEPDSILFSYTAKEMKGCLQNEGSIWKYLTRANVLHQKDLSTIRTYLGDAPFTPTLSRESPGNIGAWIGYRMIQAYMHKNKEISLEKLMELAAQTIFLNAHYKPKNTK